MDMLDFSAPKLSDAVESLSNSEIDEVPFGVVKLDQQGKVIIYNKYRAEEDGAVLPRLGLSFFTDIAPCMGNDFFKGRIEKARAAGSLNIAFDFVGDFKDRSRQLSVRVQGAKDGGTWIFMKAAA